MRTWRSLSVNIFISFLSLVFLFLFLELIVFRFVLPASDYPRLHFINGIVKYEPNQQGIYRVRNEIMARYKINANGWNSKYDEYEINSKQNKYRIAIIGDSFVEAFQVDYDKSVAERLEARLGSECSQVYRFGIGGAPMSQYLHMLRNEIMIYKPNLVVVILIHNDFSESYQFMPGVYTSSFLKIKIEDNTVTKEIQPIPYETPWYNTIRESAIWRYLVYTRQIRFQRIRDFILGNFFVRNAFARADKTESKKYQANNDISTLKENRNKNELVTDYIFSQLKEVCKKNETDLLILIDGDRDSIYQDLNKDKLSGTGALSLNLIVRSMAQKHNIHFIDLHPILAKDFSIHHKYFTFPHEGHWNSYTHDITAETISSYIKEHFEYMHLTTTED
jgi:hypothetical protein